MKEYRKVPIKDIEKLEQARKDLWDLISQLPSYQIAKYQNITLEMYKITHKKYEEIN